LGLWAVNATARAICIRRRRRSRCGAHGAAAGAGSWQRWSL